MGGIAAKDLEVAVFGYDLGETVAALHGGEFVIHRKSGFDLVLPASVCVPRRPEIADKEAGYYLRYWRVGGLGSHLGSRWICVVLRGLVLL